MVGRDSFGNILKPPISDLYRGNRYDLIQKVKTRVKFNIEIDGWNERIRIVLDYNCNIVGIGAFKIQSYV